MNRMAPASNSDESGISPSNPDYLTLTLFLRRSSDSPLFTTITYGTRESEESLRAAQICYNEGLHNSSVSPAYYSMYQAAQIALENAGIVRAEWTHAGLQATFANELTRRRKLHSAFLAPDLNIVQDLRHTADYRDSDVSRRQATRSLANKMNSSLRSRKVFPVVKSMSSSERKTLVDDCLTDLTLLAKQLCPEALIEATKETFEDEDGHVRVYPPATAKEQDVDYIGEKLAERCVDILAEKGIIICSAIYD